MRLPQDDYVLVSYVDARREKKTLVLYTHAREEEEEEEEEEGEMYMYMSFLKVNYRFLE